MESMKHASCVSASPCWAAANKEWVMHHIMFFIRIIKLIQQPKGNLRLPADLNRLSPLKQRRIARLNVSKKCFCPTNRTKATFRTASSHMLTRRIKQPQSARQGFPGTPLQIATHTILYHYKAVFASLSSFFALVVLCLDLTCFNVLKGNGHKKELLLYLKEKPPQ